MPCLFSAGGHDEQRLSGCFLPCSFTRGVRGTCRTRATVRPLDGFLSVSRADAHFLLFQFDPELVLVSGGFDSAIGDPEVRAPDLLYSFLDPV